MSMPVFVVGLLLLLCRPASAGSPEFGDRPFNDGWRFLRGQAPNALEPDFDDHGWRVVNLPHDWSVEDLPARDTDPLFTVVTLCPGRWRFSPADDPAGRQTGFDDSQWELVSLPEPWNRHGAMGGYGWYRRRFAIPAEAEGKTVLLQLGVIRGQDWTYVDGQSVHESGEGKWSNCEIQNRAIALPAEIARPGEHVIAVRVKGEPDGGFVEVIQPPSGVSALDPARSAGGIDTGYAVGGTGWYRKRFTLGPADADKSVRVVFDGSYMETTVWLNGFELGRNRYGYSPFAFDLTPHLRRGEENVLAVKVDNLGRNSRWYSGSGLYRPVHLEVGGAMHLAQWGLAVTTPEVTLEKAAVRVKVELAPADRTQAVRLELKVRNSADKIVATSYADMEATTATLAGTLQVTIPRPRFWSPESPALYRAEVTVLTDGVITDQRATTFGVHTLVWNALQGFLLNGQSIKLRGGCIHHDFGPLGAASFPRAEERRVMTLKAAGYNAIRCSHNMPSTALLEACDRLGMLVIDEAFDMWSVPKNPQDYARFFKDNWRRDIDAMLRRDRNHPSLVMWSIGNEIPERFDAAGVATAKELADHIRLVVSTRPVTAAFNDVSAKADPFLSALDICGFNYSPQSFEPDHARASNRVFFTSESFPKDSYLYWEKVTSLPYVIGDFVWTAWDYRGESGIGHTVPEGGRSSYLLGWPVANSFCGDFDVCGFPKPQSLYRQVLWGVRPAAILVGTLPPGKHSSPDLWGWPDELPHWTWPGLEGQARIVRVYARGDQVRLLLNGRELDTQRINTELTAEFTVPYAAGILRAEVLKGGAVIAREQLLSAEAPVALRLRPEESQMGATSQDIAFVAIEAGNAHGVLAPTADLPVHVSVSGEGTLAAFGNGDPRNVNSVQGDVQRLWHGRALLVVRSNGRPGRITIKAEAAGMKPAIASIPTQTLKSRQELTRKERILQSKTNESATQRARPQ